MRLLLLCHFPKSTPTIAPCFPSNILSKGKNVGGDVLKKALKIINEKRPIDMFSFVLFNTFSGKIAPMIVYEVVS